MKWLYVLLLAVIVSLATVQTASAELLYETVSDIQVPSNVTFGAQIEWQGHIVYEVKDLGTTYQVKIARDSEPHQFPYFYVSFNKNWDYLGTTRHVNPEAEKKAAEDKAKADQEAARKAQEDQARLQAEQDRQRREEEDRKKPEEPPVVKPPEEEPVPEEPDPEPTPEPTP